MLEEEPIELYSSNGSSSSQKGATPILSSNGQLPKKTKILVPLKDLMETLQQKSFLVSPLGPGKRVIRLTGSGETVKGKKAIPFFPKMTSDFSLPKESFLAVSVFRSNIYQSNRSSEYSVTVHSVHFVVPSLYVVGG